MSIIVCAPKAIEEIKKFYLCYKCKKRRLHLVKMFEWYDPHANCLKCGNTVLFGDYK